MHISLKKYRLHQIGNAQKKNAYHFLPSFIMIISAIQFMMGNCVLFGNRQIFK